MSIHKYKDWQGWWDGLRVVAMKTGAESIGTNLSAMIGTNGVASMVPVLHDYALGWKTAIGTTLTQFGIRTTIAIMDYIKNKPSPDIVEEDTQIFTKQVEEQQKVITNEKTTN